VTIAAEPPSRLSMPAARDRDVPHARRRAFDRAYWLGHCEGYRVDGAGGRIGFVEEVRGPVLVVRAGRLGRRLLLMSGDSVAFIVPREQRLWVDAERGVLATEQPA